MYHWRIINDECVSFFMKNILHYNVEFDQHDIITHIHFEGGPSFEMGHMFDVDECLFQITGVRDIRKIDTSVNSLGLFHYPFDIEVLFDVQKMKTQ